MSKVRFETLLLTIKLFERLMQKMCFNIFFTNFTFYILQHRFVKIELFKSPKSPKTLFSTSPTSTRFATFQRFTTNLGNFIVASLIETAQFILKLELWSPRNALRHSFPQAVWPQETQLLKALTPILAIEMSHHWLMHHNLFWNWSSEVSKTSKSSFFYKPSGHKKHKFRKIHSQSGRFDCCTIDWRNTFFSQIEVLKFRKPPKAFFSTSPVATRNAAFESSNANLGNLNVSSLVDASQSFLKLKLWSPQNV